MNQDRRGPFMLVRSWTPTETLSQNFLGQTLIVTIILSVPLAGALSVPNALGGFVSNGKGQEILKLVEGGI